jgi:hypothetical protein
LSGFEEKDGMLMPTFTEPTGRVFCYEHPSKLSIAINRTLPDPWEAERVVVGQSKLPQGGEGLFAKRDIPKKSLVSLYNGVRIRTCTYASKHMGHSDYRLDLCSNLTNKSKCKLLFAGFVSTPMLISTFRPTA